MKLQELIDTNQIDLNEGQVHGFLLGAQCGVKPLSFDKASTELFGDATPTPELQNSLSELWQKLQKNFNQELTDLFDPNLDAPTFLSAAHDRLDYFLTGLSLAGSVQGEEIEEVTEELENLVMDLDEASSGASLTEIKAEELKEDLLGAWEEFVHQKLN